MELDQNKYFDTKPAIFAIIVNKLYKKENVVKNIMIVIYSHYLILTFQMNSFI